MIAGPGRLAGDRRAQADGQWLLDAVGSSPVWLEDRLGLIVGDSVSIVYHGDDDLAEWSGCCRRNHSE